MEHLYQTAVSDLLRMVVMLCSNSELGTSWNRTQAIPLIDVSVSLDLVDLIPEIGLINLGVGIPVGAHCFDVASTCKVTTATHGNS